MRQYKTVQVPKRVIESLRCNCCGKVIQSRECFSAVKHWGYDSPYDGEVHAMDICAECYAAWIQNFAISPVLTEEKRESEEG